MSAGLLLKEAFPAKGDRMRIVCEWPDLDLVNQKVRTVLVDRQMVESRHQDGDQDFEHVFERGACLK